MLHNAPMCACLEDYFSCAVLQLDNGILRQLIRDYLASVPNVVQYRDEHVQFGGAGITVVEL